MNQYRKQFKIQKRRKIRVRARISGTASRPRLSVFRSNTGFYAQLIDDVNGKTLIAVSPKLLTKKIAGKINQSLELGKMLAESAKKAGIESAVFDRGSYRYHGRVKAFADGAREGGLKI
jgi:large subunit ribosomal protein L18